MARHLLTALQVQNAKPKKKPYRLADGDGLYLYVPLSGASSWQFRYRLGAKPQTATLGRLDPITLGQARAKAQDVRTLAADGHHVTAVRRVERAKRAAARTATFGVLSADWLKREARRGQSISRNCRMVRPASRTIPPMVMALTGLWRGMVRIRDPLPMTACLPWRRTANPAYSSIG
jgi:hypothetical protein